MVRANGGDCAVLFNQIFRLCIGRGRLYHCHHTQNEPRTLSWIPQLISIGSILLLHEYARPLLHAQEYAKYRSKHLNAQKAYKVTKFRYRPFLIYNTSKLIVQPLSSHIFFFRLMRRHPVATTYAANATNAAANDDAAAANDATAAANANARYIRE